MGIENKNNSICQWLPLWFKGQMIKAEEYISLSDKQ
jgi:hypothetical protein